MIHVYIVIIQYQPRYYTQNKNLKCLGSDRRIVNEQVSKIDGAFRQVNKPSVKQQSILMHKKIHNRVSEKRSLLFAAGVNCNSKLESSLHSILLDISCPRGTFLTIDYLQAENVQATRRGMKCVFICVAPGRDIERPR